MNFSEELKKYLIIDIVAKSAAELGVESYIIGGFVRDLILKRNSKDIGLLRLIMF